MVSMGASIVTSVVETLWTQDAAFSWIALQMGVAMLGASVGSTVVEKGEEVICGLLSWGWNKANKIQQETRNYFGFWAVETPAREIICNPMSSTNTAMLKM